MDSVNTARRISKVRSKPNERRGKEKKRKQNKQRGERKIPKGREDRKSSKEKEEMEEERGAAKRKGNDKKAVKAIDSLSVSLSLSLCFFPSVPF